jgi:hypothetical protein
LLQGRCGLRRRRPLHHRVVLHCERQMRLRPSRRVLRARRRLRRPRPMHAGPLRHEQTRLRARRDRRVLHRGLRLRRRPPVHDRPMQRRRVRLPSSDGTGLCRRRRGRSRRLDAARERCRRNAVGLVPCADGNRATRTDRHEHDAATPRGPRGRWQATLAVEPPLVVERRIVLRVQCREASVRGRRVRGRFARPGPAHGEATRCALARARSACLTACPRVSESTLRSGPSRLVVGSASSASPDP